MAPGHHGVDFVIRFTPDNWLDVLMRPLDMIAPEANTYVEIAAPETRLAAAVLLAGLVLVLWRRRAAQGKPTLWLLALLAVSTAPWLATTGNGRYFIVWLVLLGPLCMGLIRLLPMKGERKLLLGGGLIAAQLFVLTQNPPWESWAWLRWTDPPYFQLDPPPAEPATYVTIANISYSLIAPQFPPQSRWVALGGGVAERDQPAVDKLLATSVRLTLIAPALPSQTLADGQPAEAAADALGKLLRPHGLSIRPGAQCRLLASDGMARIGERQGSHAVDRSVKKWGFWLCPLEYRGRPETAPIDGDPAVNAVFEAVEQQCPRFFPAGAVPMKINGGWLKNYDSDTKLYVLDEGPVYYKFWRSLNAVEVGTRQSVVEGKASIDCAKIRAPNWRHGGP
jgi:hypothetical protein